MEIEVVTDWFQSKDQRTPKDPLVQGRMVEIKRNGKVWPAVEQRCQGGEYQNHDICHTWAAPEKLSDDDYIKITNRFPAVFEAYEIAKRKRADEAAQREAEIQARIEAEVAKQVAAKTKKAVAKEV